MFMWAKDCQWRIDKPTTSYTIAHHQYILSNSAHAPSTWTVH